MREQQVGDPRALAVDVGPVIDAEARAGIERHIEAMRARGRRVWQPLGDSAPGAGGAAPHGHFVAPTLIEIHALTELEREVFGPVLHVLRYGRDELPALLQQINATGYGLTCGVHTRIDETMAQVAQTVRAGNVYVNRNVVGAVVGVQPFGGEGLSGTGPKAGGPLYLLRLLAERPAGAARKAVDHAGHAAAAPARGFALDTGGHEAARSLGALRGWALAQGDTTLAAACDRFAAASPVGRWQALPGPTGEANLYAVLPRERVLCLAAAPADRLTQLAAVLAVGARALWPADEAALRERLPADVRDQVDLVQDWRSGAAHFDAVLHAGTDEDLRQVLATLAARPGPIVAVSRLQGADVVLERLVTERSLSVNTAAAGGNATLMTMG
jgi:RHH-type proline utilization regulon transcriptional repressor/proline dehydrogenase/delta 1-pyrroline-5-carboxylate dehydrogenase